jgi:hypothetical protein
MAQFDLIGAYDKVSKDRTATLACIGIAPAPPRRELNRTADLVPEYDARKLEILSERRMMGQAPDIFADDLRFYERYAR